MCSIPNLLTILRLPLAFVFLQDNAIVRAIALILAGLSDVLDGYIARRFGVSTRLGNVLDPIMDKFFAFFVLGILLSEHRLAEWEAATMLCRDLAVLLFGIYLAYRKSLGKYKVQAILCGKITTTLQFSIFMGLLFGVTFPPIIFFSFIILGISALVELYLEHNKSLSSS